MHLIDANGNKSDLSVRESDDLEFRLVKEKFNDVDGDGEVWSVKLYEVPKYRTVDGSLWPVLFRGVQNKKEAMSGSLLESSYAWFSTSADNSKQYGYIGCCTTRVPFRLIAMDDEKTRETVARYWEANIDDVNEDRAREGLAKLNTNTIQRMYPVDEETGTVLRDTSYKFDNMFNEFLAGESPQDGLLAQLEAQGWASSSMVTDAEEQSHHAEMVIFEPLNFLRNLGLVDLNYNDSGIGAKKVAYELKASREKSKSTKPVATDEPKPRGKKLNFDDM